MRVPDTARENSMIGVSASTRRGLTQGPTKMNAPDPTKIGRPRRSTILSRQDARRGVSKTESGRPQLALRTMSECKLNESESEKLSALCSRSVAGLGIANEGGAMTTNM